MRLEILNEPGIIDRLKAVMFAPDYPGYTPLVAEAPDGDSRVDTGKRYSHVTTGHLDEMGAGDRGEFLDRAFMQAFKKAQRFHIKFGYPTGAPPDINECCLRLLEYPPGVGGEAHTDMDMFTLNLWRSHPEHCVPDFNAIHVGELGEIMQPDLRVATRHKVRACHELQTSLVFFALPSRDTTVPGHGTMGGWLDERKARSRVAK